MSVRHSPYAFVAEVARYLAVEPADVRRLIRQHALPATRLPAATRVVHRIPLRDFHAWLLRQTPSPETALHLADYPTFLEDFRAAGRPD